MKTKEKKTELKNIVINLEAAKWCFDRGYKIYPKPIEFKDPDRFQNKLGVKFRLVVEFGGDKKIGEREYSQEEWPRAIWSVYNFLYKKHNETN